MKFSGNGIAAVVGPNGCGKSNLSDAISWVLGEQSAKSLRGARMEDVIFAGTRDRKALGMASVTMTLVPDEAKLAAVLVSNVGSEVVSKAPETAQGIGPQEVTLAIAPATEMVGVAGEPLVLNGNGHPHNPPPPAEALKAAERTGEVTITRRLYRSGESEYLINGRTARLRDIQDLFLGTGLGPESYAIIEQGRIGQILSNKPQDRRAVIEEAAGITRFKNRKRLAEAKLESARQNLARVFDILEEVTRQVNSLKRQAAKTKRYKELKEEATGFLRQVLAARFQLLERESARLAIELSTAIAELEAAKTAISERETGQMAVVESSYATEHELTAARKLLADLNLEDERTRGKLDYQLRQIQQIDSRLANGTREAESLECQQMERAAELEQQTIGLEALAAEFAAARELLDAKSAERQTVQNQLAEQERTLEAARQRVLRLLNEAAALKNRTTQVEAQLATADRDTLRARQEEQQSQGDLERIQGVKAKLSERLSSRQTELISVTDLRKEVEQQLHQKRGQLNESRQVVERLRGEFSRVKARRDSLDEVILHRSYTTETVKRLFSAVDKGQTPDFKPVGVLADFLEVDPQYEKATEEFLHDELEFVVVRNWEDAERGVELMRAEMNGRATFLAEHAGDELEAPAELAMPTAPPGALTRLTEVLRFTNGLTELPSHWLPRIANCFIAEDRGLARQLATQFPHCWFLTKDGINYHGRAVSGGKKSGAGPLALKRELREVTLLEKTRQAELSAAQNQLAELEQSIHHLTEHLEQLRARQQAQEKEVLVMDQETRKLAEEFQRVNSRLSGARLELDRIGRDRVKLEEALELARITLEEREALRSQEEYGLEAAREDLSGLQSEAARAAEEHSGMRANLASLEERRRSLIGTRGRLENQVRDFASRRLHLANETERLTAEKTSFLQSNAGLQTKAAELKTQIAGVEENVLRLAGQEAELRSQLAAVEEELRRLRAEAQSGQERRSELQVRMARAESDLKHLEETAAKELETTMAALVAGVETIPDEKTLTEIDVRHTEVRRKIEALGPVNPTALEEYEESAQRQEFLTAQRTDLLDSIRDTEKAIQEIDGESRKRFGEAFHAINANFKTMFQDLFGGGTGEMRLTDEDNLAESGIDIVASPPGKRLQSVLLLSGGEKSMTAMALLMSIFQYTPSPFCILDEVDAPLDEPNIERLTRLLKDMSEQTQFIVITHAKRTMEVAQSLYGVTMQEPGVSKLVSVKFKAPVDGQVQKTRMITQAQRESEELLEAARA
jgi:chromosome segregation protein